MFGPSFVILHCASPADAPIPDVVASEQSKSVVIVDDEKQAHLHGLVFRALSKACLDPVASARLILALPKRAGQEAATARFAPELPAVYQ